MRWMLVLLLVAVVIVVAAILLGPGAGGPSDGDGEGERYGAAREESPSGDGGALLDQPGTGPDDRSAGGGVGGRSEEVADLPEGGAEGPTVPDAHGERGERAGEGGPRLAGNVPSAPPEVDEGDPSAVGGALESTVRVRVLREGVEEPLPGAMVVLIDARKRRHEVRADAAGEARFLDVVPGRAYIDAVLEGWVVRWIHEEAVPDAGGLSIDLRMQPAVPVRGFVRTAEDGQPVAGARVTAVAGGRVHESQGWRTSSRGVYSTVETDATGAFRFPALPPGEVCTLAVLACGYRYAARGILPTADGEEGEPIEILLEPGGRLLGRVTSPSGEPVAGAVVYVFPEGDANLARHPAVGRLGRRSVSLRGVSDDDGRFEVIGLAFEERFAATAMAEGYLRARNVDGIVVSSAAPEASIELRFGQAGGFRVRVLDVDGRPLGRGWVICVQSRRYSARVPIGPDGRAVLECVPPGDYQIRAESEGFRANRSTATVGAGETVEVEIRLEPQPPGIDVTGVAVDDEGNTIPDLRITGASPKATQTVRTTTDADGRFVLSGLQSGKVRIGASGKGYERTLVEVEAPAEAVRLVVPRITRVRGHVELAPGVAKPDFIALCWEPLDQARGGGRTSHPFLDGSFETSVTPETRFRLQVCGETFAPWTREIRVARGETLDLGTIRVVSGIDVAGVVLDPDGKPLAGVVLEVALNFIVWRTDTTDTEGRFRLAHLPTGSLAVKLRAEGYEVQVHDLEASASLGDVRLVLTQGD